MRKVDLGVAGCGVVALQDYLPALFLPEVREKVRVTAVADSLEDRARAVADRFGVKAWFTDVGRMIEQADIEAVALLTPIPVHYPQCRAALENGKHVYVQKTMTATYREADEVVRLARAKRLKLCASPGQMLDPAHQMARRLLDEGAVGKVCYVRAHGSHPGHESQQLFGRDPSWYYQPGGGPVRDVAVYALHTITGIVGPVRRVIAFSGVAIPNRHWEDRDIEVREDDNTAILLDLGESRFALVDASYCARRCRVPMFEFYGSRGTIYIGGWTVPSEPIKVYIESDILGSPAGWYVPERPWDAFPSLPVKPTAWDLIHFVDCILEDREPVPSGTHARHVIEVIDKIYQAARTGTSQLIETGL